MGWLENNILEVDGMTLCIKVSWNNLIADVMFPRTRRSWRHTGVIITSSMGVGTSRSLV